MRACILFAEATPKAIMRTMNVKGLTLFHLKSHLQVSFFIIELYHGVCYQSLNTYCFLLHYRNTD